MDKRNGNGLNPFAEIKKFKEMDKKVREQQSKNKQISKSSSFKETTLVPTKSQNQDLLAKLTQIVNVGVNSFKNLKPNNVSYILVRIEYKSENGEVISLFNFDFGPVKSIVIKDIVSNKYSRIYKREVYSYYVEDKFLYLKLKNDTRLKIRYFN